MISVLLHEVMPFARLHGCCKKNLGDTFAKSS